MGTRHRGSNTEASALDAHSKLMCASESEAGNIEQNLRPADGRGLSQVGAVGGSETWGLYARVPERVGHQDPQE